MTLEQSLSNTTDALESVKPRQLTAARIGIGRSGGSLTTSQILDFDLAHARARDAVHFAFQCEWLKNQIQDIFTENGMESPVLELQSMAGDKATYLKRPDFGRRLSTKSAEMLAQVEKGRDLAIVISDGLSAQAITQVPALLRAWLPLIHSAGFVLAPIMIIPLARVAISDHVGDIIGARTTVILLGERPGLATPESLGAYLTFEPRTGRTDADRNCISNIHAEGLQADVAAALLQSLVANALRQGLGGVNLSQQMAHMGGLEVQS